MILNSETRKYTKKPMIFKRIIDEIDTFFERDPAARSRLEIILAYPGFHAVMFYRMSHWAWKRNFRVLARFLSHLGRIFTGIEIHPGATIGKNFFVDHGMGVVIGETAEIGDNVTIYQGVTLGGTSLEKGKRHPTLEDDVTVGSGAQVLGPLRLAKGSRVGANAVVLSDVPPDVTVVGIPAKIVMSKEDREDHHFRAYGLPKGKGVDPVAQTMENLRNQMNELKTRLDRLEGVEAGSAGELKAVPSDRNETSDADLQAAKPAKGGQ